MRCDEFEIRLQQRLDDRRFLGGDAVLIAHADRCAPCRALLVSYEALFDGLAASHVAEMPEELAEHVVERWQAEQSRPVHRTYLRRMALAATLLIAALPAWWWLSWKSNEAATAPPEENHVASVPSVAAPAHVQSPAQADALLFARDELVSALSWLPLQDQTNESLGATDAYDARLRKVTQLATGMEPIAVSAGRSVVALIRALPLAEQQPLTQ